MYWLQFSIIGSKFYGVIAILKTWHLHVKRYEIDSLTKVYYLFTSCCHTLGSGRTLGPSIYELMRIAQKYMSGRIVEGLIAKTISFWEKEQRSTEKEMEG